VRIGQVAWIEIGLEGLDRCPERLAVGRYVCTRLVLQRGHLHIGEVRVSVLNVSDGAGGRLDGGSDPAVALCPDECPLLFQGLGPYWGVR